MLFIMIDRTIFGDKRVILRYGFTVTKNVQSTIEINFKIVLNETDAIYGLIGSIYNVSYKVKTGVIILIQILTVKYIVLVSVRYFIHLQIYLKSKLK